MINVERFGKMREKDAGGAGSLPPKACWRAVPGLKLAPGSSGPEWLRHTRPIG
jgi:hypothetical protein